MPNHQFDCVWPKPSDAVKDEAVSFWLGESAMVEGVARERAEQLLIVARDPQTMKITAVSTASPYLVPTLGLRCFYFRAFVAAQHRARGLRSSHIIHQLIRHSYDALNARYQDGLHPDVVGLYLEVQNPSVLRNRRQLVWTDLGANIQFMGFLPNGAQARVWYFERSVLPG